MSASIEIEALSKRYYLGTGGNGYRTLRETIVDACAAILPARAERKPRESEPFWALRDVNCQISPGDVVGIIGGNGAGKSTLLKILSRITKPTTGRVTLRGRVGSLLEVGTGFHPELSGRENIYLAGVVLGMSRREVARKFDEIVEFAEMSQFLDTPVKRYSSGMYVRLAFAVAAHLETEILLVDEVLAVGDINFQRKCLGKMSQVSRVGRTILFVSHNMGAITRLCRQAIWLEAGRVRQMGPVEDVVAGYLASGTREQGEVIYQDNGSPAPGSEYVRLRAIRVRDRSDSINAAIDIRYPFTLEVEYEVLRPSEDLRVGVRLTAHDGTVLISSTDRDDADPHAPIMRTPGVYVSRCTIPGDFLNAGQYFVSVGADFPMLQSHFLVDQGLAFRIEQTGGAGGHVSDGRAGLLRMRLPWDANKLN